MVVSTIAPVWAQGYWLSQRPPSDHGYSLSQRLCHDNSTINIVVTITVAIIVVIILNPQMPNYYYFY